MRTRTRKAAARASGRRAVFARLGSAQGLQPVGSTRIFAQSGDASCPGSASRRTARRATRLARGWSVDHARRRSASAPPGRCTPRVLQRRTAGGTETQPYHGHDLRPAIHGRRMGHATAPDRRQPHPMARHAPARSWWSRAPSACRARWRKAGAARRQSAPGRPSVGSAIMCSRTRSASDVAFSFAMMVAR